jgi:hypothetical protein
MKKSSASLGRGLEQNVNFGYLHVFEFSLVNTRFTVEISEAGKCLIIKYFSVLVLE